MRSAPQGYERGMRCSTFKRVSSRPTRSQWAEKAGLVLSQDQFTDVYGFDDEVRLSGDIVRSECLIEPSTQLLAMVPQPVKAIVMLFPITDAYETARKAEDAQVLEKGQPALDPTILWIKQTVRSNCVCQPFILSL